jgi:hypothetical protein
VPPLQSPLHLAGGGGSTDSINRFNGLNKEATQGGSGPGDQFEKFVPSGGARFVLRLALTATEAKQSQRESVIATCRRLAIPVNVWDGLPDSEADFRFRFRKNNK